MRLLLSPTPRLHDPRTDALVATLLKENIDQIRAELAGRELRERTQG